MKVHYINILLFALSLNILVYNQRNHNSCTPHTHTNRSLCECELYAPANYDSDPEMKKVMENFNRQTNERFHEYDDRMKTTRQKCKDKCDKEIQKIVLKDKLEKELMDKFATLQTDIQSDAIPTCICEKSLADKVEKGCLRCAKNLGGIVAPSTGILGEIAALALSGWKTAAIDAATKYAMTLGAAAGKIFGEIAGEEAVIKGLQALEVRRIKYGILDNFFREIRYTNTSKIIKVIFDQHEANCISLENGITTAGCNNFQVKVGIRTPGSKTTIGAKEPITEKVTEIVGEAKQVAAKAEAATRETATNAITAEKTGEITATYASYQTAIIASIVAIVVIILIMVIIYLILRYRRKKKMKKKLQYIKLLEE
ncbi:rifin [Plasmodium reichenowi]|uniref:Rifin n=1 Tax=Plasmodium reichenowi TaxID=5854 RepID=A0A060RQB7_PLARE|nr:rifin [Plasmodium reichenowi]